VCVCVRSSSDNRRLIIRRVDNDFPDRGTNVNFENAERRVLNPRSSWTRVFCSRWSRAPAFSTCAR